MQRPDLCEKFSTAHDESIRTLMELMNESWLSIQLMPYQFFAKTVKWKIDLEEKKKEEYIKKQKEQELQQKKRAEMQKAEERRVQSKQRQQSMRKR